MKATSLQRSKEPIVTAPKSAWWIRAAFVALGLVIWFWSQSLIGKRAFPSDGIGDGMHQLLAPVHQYLFQNTGAANVLLIVSSAVIDAVGVFLLFGSVFGKSVRPFIGLVVVLGMRQVCQAVCALPPPPEMIWRNPGFPSLLVTYGVANDLFFSGHTAIAVLGAIELARTGKRSLAILGIGIALFEAVTVLALRAHYTMDVFTGAIAAVFAGQLALKFAPTFDRLLTQMLIRKAVQRF
jgi:membrane-associated phospholipid phosphatase